jgi:sugar/nucleoside kinase (ribokinase family)
MFAGAFLYALVEGHSFAIAAEFAALSAATVVAQWGPRLRPEQYGKLRDDFFA